MSLIGIRPGLLACSMIILGSAGAWGASFSYTTLIPPGATQANLGGIYNDTAVVDATATSTGAWIWSAGSFTALPNLGDAGPVSDNGLVLGSPASFEYAIYNLTTGKMKTYKLPFSGDTTAFATGINASGTVSVTALTGEGRDQIVTTLLQDTSGNDTPIEMQKNGPYALGISDNDVVPLYTIQDKHHSEIYQNGEVNPLTVPKAKVVVAQGINGAGVTFGFARKGGNSYNFGFTYDGTTVTKYKVPGSSNTVVSGLSPAGVAVGFYDVGDVSHGFIYANKKYITIDYPGSSSTYLYGMSSTGSIIGYYTPTGPQVNPIPFIGVCSSQNGCTE